MNRRFFTPVNKRRIPGSFNRAGALLVSGLLMFTVFSTVFGALKPAISSAASSSTLTFQARLLNTSGSLVADGTYNVEFKIYDTVGSGASAQGVCSLDSSTDDCWWLETRTGANKVTVKNGYIYANLGSVTAFSSTVPWDQELWITMNIGGTGAPSWDGEMSPRFKVAAVPYALSAATLQVTASAITNKLVFATPSSSNKTITLPNETGTVCTTGSVCSGYASAAGYATISLNNIASTNLSAALNATSGNLALQTTTSGNITATTATTSGLFNILTGNLKVGSGTPGVTLNGDDAYITGTLEVASDTTLTGNLAVNGGTLTTTQATFNLLNTTATTVNAFGAATAINIGAAAGTTITPGGNLTFAEGATKGLTVQSSLASAGRTTAALTLTQANDVTNNASSTGYLLDVQQLDTATAIAAVNINNASTTTGGVALSVTNANTNGSSAGILITGVAGANVQGISIAGITTGKGFQNTSTTTGSGIVVGGTTITSGDGVLFNTTNNGFTSGKALNISGNASAITADFTGSYISVAPTRTQTAAATRTESGNFLTLTRANTTNGASSIMNITGDLATLSSTCTQTLGTCTDTSNILQLTQSYATASGEVLRVDGAGTGNLATLDATAATANGVLIDVQSSSASQYALKVTANNGATTALQVNGDGSISLGATGVTTTNNGALTVTQLLTGSLGATISGATSSINASSNFATNINTGTSNGTVTIGGGSAPLVIDSTNFDVSSAGALSGITTIATSSTINSQTISSSANFTGTLAVNGASVTIGTASTTNGTVKLLNSTNAFGVTISASGQTVGSATVSLPNTAGVADTFCLLTVANCAAAGGANTALSNLSSVAINTALLPGADNTIDLGSVAASFRTLYSDTSVLTPTLDTAAAAALNIGTTTQNALTVGRAGATTAVTGSTVTFNGSTVVSGSNTFTTGTGTVSLQGDTTVASGKSLTLAGGASNILATNAATATTATTSGTGTNTTTVTLTGSAFANNDVILIDNAGQDYYTRITAGGGTATLTVSPAVTFETARTVTRYTTQNIGATTSDYTTLTNRFFQGYFLGGVVTGAGSTTLSDGTLNSTGNLVLQSTSGNVGIGTGTTAPVSLLSVGSTSQFQVNSSGAIAAATGIANSGGYVQSGTTANTFTGASTFSAAGTALSVTNNATIGGTLAVSGASVTVGTASTINGTLVFQNSTNAFTSTITASGITGSSKTITIPNETGMICTTGSVCSGYQASVSGGAANQQLSNLSGTVAINLALLPGADNTIDLGSVAASFRTLYSDTSVLTPLVDTSAAAALGIGTGTQNALTVGRAGATTAVTGSTVTFNGTTSVSGSNTFTTGTGTVSLQGDTTISAGKNLTLSSGAGVFAQTSTAITGDIRTVTANSFSPAASATGNGETVTVTQAATNTTGNSAVNAYNASATLNTSGATGTKDLSLFNAAAATLTGCTGGGCIVSGIKVATQTTGAASTISQYGVNVQPSDGVSAGTLIGVNVGSIATPGAGTERGLSVGSGWDANLFFNDTTTVVQVADGGAIAFQDSGGNSLFSITDAGTTGDINFTGKLKEDGVEVLSSIIAAYATTCPTGWTEYTAARGRYIVGTVSGGTDTATVGTALSNSENRPTGAHSHPSSSHSHAASADSNGTGYPYRLEGNGDWGPALDGGGTSSGWHVNPATSSATTVTPTTTDANQAGTGTAGTNAPYIQLKYCQKTAGSDLAEWTDTNEKLEPGTIVSIDKNDTQKIVSSKVAYDVTASGVVSTEPGWTLGAELKEKNDKQVQLALTGRVPVKVTTVNGSIKAGDPITTSGTPGVGMKATKAGTIIGRAMEDFIPDADGNGKVTVLLNTTWQDPSKWSTLKVPDISMIAGWLIIAAVIISTNRYTRSRRMHTRAA